LPIKFLPHLPYWFGGSDDVVVGATKMGKTKTKMQKMEKYGTKKMRIFWYMITWNNK